MAEEGEKTSLKQLIQGMVGKDVEVLQGIVKSTDPLKIQMVNDEKLEIGPNITYIPKHLTDHETVVDISQDDEFGAISYRATVTVYNALKIGERVHLLSFKHGKQYYVLDRVG